MSGGLAEEMWKGARMSVVDKRSDLSKGNGNVLQIALLANGTFSGVCGYSMMMFASPVSGLLGIRGPAMEWVVMGLGAILVVYALSLFLIAMPLDIPRGWVKVAIVLDIAWVLGSALLLMGDWLPFSLLGQGVVGAIAFLVSGFALAQYLGLRRYSWGR